MRIGIIGVGRAGGSLLHALQEKAAILSGVCGLVEQEESFRQKESGIEFFIEPLELVRNSEVIFLTVQDEQIADVAKGLVQAVEQEGIAWSEKTFFHCSGATELEALQPLAKMGATIGSWHPLQSFVSQYGSFQNVYVALDGLERACQIGEYIADILGCVTFRVPSRERTRYHAAACLTSNYVVTLLAEAQGLLAEWTQTPGEALQALVPLLEGTVANLKKVELATEALSGPIARGDFITVQAHIQSLPPDLLPLYKSLGLKTLELVRKSGNIEATQYQKIKTILQENA